MIAIPGNVRVWLATGHTDMRRGFPSLARLVQEDLKRDPHAGDLYVFRGRRGGLIKIIWHDGHGACLLRHLSSLRRLRARLFKKRKFSRKIRKSVFRLEVIRRS
jgi:transposase